MYLDIEKIKREVTMAQILDYYGIELKKKGKQGLYGSCPIHYGDNQNAFHVDLGKNLFHCFSHCGGGSIIDFVMKKEQLSFYKAALKIWQTFFSKKNLRSNTDSLINIEIDIEVHHPYLIRRGIDEKLASFFQIRYDSHGRMRDRIVIPIMDRYKKQVGCCGRVVHPGILPKYLFSKDFKKSFHLYNIQNIVPHCRMPVFIVEGFFDCIHVTVNGFDCVALMGNSISTYQLELLKEMERNYILMLDGDDAGRKATQRVDIPLGCTGGFTDPNGPGLDIVAIVLNRTFRLTLTYDTEVYQGLTIKKFMAHFQKALEKIIDHCTAKKESEITLSDLSSTRVDAREFEAMFDALEEITVEK